MKAGRHSLPYATQIHRALGAAYLGTKEPAKALSELEAASELKPKDDEIELAYAKGLAALGRKDDAKSRRAGCACRSLSLRFTAKLGRHSLPYVSRRDDSMSLRDERVKIAMVLLAILFRPSIVQAKRGPAPLIAPVIRDGVEYSVSPQPEWREETKASVSLYAKDVKTGSRLWTLELYQIKLNPKIEGDV
jgi:hypothetical protein